MKNKNLSCIALILGMLACIALLVNMLRNNPGDDFLAISLEEIIPGVNRGFLEKHIAALHYLDINICNETGGFEYPDSVESVHIDDDGNLVIIVIPGSDNLQTLINQINNIPYAIARVEAFCGSEVMRVMHQIENILSENPDHPMRRYITCFGPGGTRNRLAVGLYPYNEEVIAFFRETMLDLPIIEFMPGEFAIPD